MRRHHLSDRKKALVGGRPRALSPPGGAGGRKEKGGAALAEGREDGGEGAGDEGISFGIAYGFL
jgi:hypothetical protein